MIGTPPDTRLILAYDGLLDDFGTRTNYGARITAEWGEQRPEGWYEPTFTVHNDDNPLENAHEKMRLWVDYWMAREATEFQPEEAIAAIQLMVRQFRAILDVERPE